MGERPTHPEGGGTEGCRGGPRGPRGSGRRAGGGGARAEGRGEHARSALDEHLPVRTHKAPHSTEPEGPLLLSRTDRGLDHVTFTQLLRDVAATHPDLKDIAPTLPPDVVAHSPSPFATEAGETGGDRLHRWAVHN
ncbi:hypothetical protein [Streptomyces hirsutus]|uniref:hypothetical protein n=1 Tax=Streptomyces hirsutus TaxID=35620 RepID=UPI003330188A